MNTNHTQTLDLAKEGKWEAAHARVQPHSDRKSCLIHGYLHRVEGNQGNARYWYMRAGDDMPDNSLEAEWRRLYELVSQ